MGGGDALRHIGEEGRDLRFDAEPRIGVLDPADIVGARLLDDGKPPPLVFGQQRDCRGDGI